MGQIQAETSTQTRCGSIKAILLVAYIYIFGIGSPAFHHVESFHSSVFFVCLSEILNRLEKAKRDRKKASRASSSLETGTFPKLIPIFFQVDRSRKRKVEEQAFFAV